MYVGLHFVRILAVFCEKRFEIAIAAKTRLPSNLNYNAKRFQIIRKSISNKHCCLSFNDRFDYAHHYGFILLQFCKKICSQRLLMLQTCLRATISWIANVLALECWILS